MKKAFLSILVLLVATAYVAQSDTTPEEELISSPEIFESFIAMQKTQKKPSLAQELALPPFNKVFTVGSQRRSCFKSTKIRAGCKCPAVVRKGVWANRGRHKNAQDIFKVTSSVHSTKLTVKRVDKAGRDCHGWGMNLQVICKCFNHNQWAPKIEKKRERVMKYHKKHRERHMKFRGKRRAAYKRRRAAYKKRCFRSKKCKKRYLCMRNKKCRAAYFAKRRAAHKRCMRNKKCRAAYFARRMAARKRCMKNKRCRR